MDLDGMDKLAEEHSMPVSYSNPDTLLKKFDIPVSHLDFGYVEKCNDGRELEKILQILQSGEEGHYPDLMRKTEEKLGVVKPSSRYIRKVTPIVDFSSLDKEEREDLAQDLDAWRQEVAQQNNELNQHKKVKASTYALPEVRKGTKVIAEGSRAKEGRIKSTDYGAWDKYDPDTEILKMDLVTERMRREAGFKVQAESEEARKNVKVAEFVTATEAVTEALHEREKGNEYYRSKDYKQAVICYSNSIRFQPTIANHSNRAQAYIKLKRYEEAVRDCKSALKFDPDNVKANLRLATCLEVLQRFPEALRAAEKVIQLEPNNVAAQNCVNKIAALIRPPALPTTRMKIVEIDEAKDDSVAAAMKSASSKGNLMSQKGKSILKKSGASEASRDKVLLPIPGPSTMTEPYYIVVENEDPEIVRRQEYMINNKPHTMFCTTIYDDEFECTEIHRPEAEERRSLANVTNQELAMEMQCEKIAEVGAGHDKENYQGGCAEATSNRVIDSACEPIVGSELPNDQLKPQTMEEYEEFLRIRRRHIEMQPGCVNGKRYKNYHPNVPNFAASYAPNQGLDHDEHQTNLGQSTTALPGGDIIDILVRAENEGGQIEDYEVLLPLETITEVEPGIEWELYSLLHDTTPIKKTGDSSKDIIQQTIVTGGCRSEEAGEVNGIDALIEPSPENLEENEEDMGNIGWIDPNEVLEEESNVVASVVTVNDADAASGGGQPHVNDKDALVNVNEAMIDPNEVLEEKSNVVAPEVAVNGADTASGGGEPHVNDKDALVNVNEAMNFQPMWLAARKDRSYVQQAALLQQLDLSRLRQIIGLSLNAAMLSDMLNTLYMHFMVPHQVSHMHALLTQLARLPRFSINVMFLRRSDQNTVQCLLDFLDQHGKPLSVEVRKCFQRTY